MPSQFPLSVTDRSSRPAVQIGQPLSDGIFHSSAICFKGTWVFSDSILKVIQERSLLFFPPQSAVLSSPRCCAVSLTTLAVDSRHPLYHRFRENIRSASLCVGQLDVYSRGDQWSLLFPSKANCLRGVIHFFTVSFIKTKKSAAETADFIMLAVVSDSFQHQPLPWKER